MNTAYRLDTKMSLVRPKPIWQINAMAACAATYCVIIQTQRTQISGRKSNGIKHSGGPLEDGHEKRPKHVGVLYLQTRFQHFIVFKC
jgi:hypothetical protein